jgi:hypothetical protein
MRLAVGIAMMVVAAVLVVLYGRELWINATRPDRFDDLVKQTMTHGEGGGQEVGRNDRLFFSYPFLILGFGIGGWLLATAP